MLEERVSGCLFVTVQKESCQERVDDDLTLRRSDSFGIENFGDQSPQRSARHVVISAMTKVLAQSAMYTL